jgi:hypothetical protein
VLSRVDGKFFNQSKWEILLARVNKECWRGIGVPKSSPGFYISLMSTVMNSGDLYLFGLDTRGMLCSASSKVGSISVVVAILIGGTAAD